MTPERTASAASREITRHRSVFEVADCLGRVVTNECVRGEYKRLVLAGEGPAVRAEPGQFFQILCPAFEPDAPYLRRPMSVYGANADRGHVEFLYKVTGAGTRGLAALTPGAVVSIFGPLGNGFRLDGSWKNIVVVGRGVGLATLAPLAELAAERRIALTAILSARSEAHLISVDRFVMASARVIAVIDSDGSSDPRNVEEILRELVAAGLADAFFTCGSNRLLLLLQGIARECGIPGQVAIEQQMACGLGMCFSCVRAFNVSGRMVSRRVCWDGPVFDLQEASGW